MPWSGFSENRPTVAGDCFAPRQDIEQWLQMPLVMPPAPDRAVEDRLSHLPEAGREDRAIGAMEIEATRLPVEAEEFDQAAAFAFGVCDQRLVVDGNHLQRQHSPPVLGKALDFEIPPRAIGEVVSEGISLAEPLEIAGEAGITHITPAEDDAGCREQDCNDAEMKNIVRHLVRHPQGAARPPLQIGDVPAGELPGKIHIPFLDRPIAVTRHHRIGNAGDVLALAAAKNAGVAGSDLLDQTRPRARHADDKDRQLGTVAPPCSGRERCRSGARGHLIHFAGQHIRIETLACL